MKKLTNKAKSSDNRYSGTILLKCKIDAWDKNFQKYDEESWMTSITEKNKYRSYGDTRSL